MKFHEMFKEKRMRIGTVREFARETGLDVAYVSRLENGVTLPPKDSTKLARLASALGITEGTEEWQRFFDLAAVAKNQLPDDLRDDERIISVLPAFYRALRNRAMDDDELKKLLKLLKDSKGEE